MIKSRIIFKLKVFLWWMNTVIKFFFSEFRKFCRLTRAWFIFKCKVLLILLMLLYLLFRVIWIGLFYFLIRLLQRIFIFNLRMNRNYLLNTVLFFYPTFLSIFSKYFNILRVKYCSLNNYSKFSLVVKVAENLYLFKLIIIQNGERWNGK